MTLVEFLLARIAEDEEIARRDPDVYARWVGEWSQQDYESVWDVRPGRLAAACKAKRRLVELHRWDNGTADPCDAHDGVSMESVYCESLSLLALPYADHFDYDEAWRP